MTSSALELRWSGPWSWDSPNSVFEQPAAAHPGLYLWGVPQADGLLAYYVGETVEPRYRLAQHRDAYRAGEYRLYDPESFAAGRLEVVWGGTWGPEERPGRGTAEEFRRRHAELNPIVDAMLNRTHVLIAPFNGDTRTRKRIEAAFARHLQHQPPPVGSFQEPDIYYADRRSDEEPVRVHFTYEVSVQGAPTTLEV